MFEDNYLVPTSYYPLQEVELVELTRCKQNHNSAHSVNRVEAIIKKNRDALRTYGSAVNAVAKAVLV